MDEINIQRFKAILNNLHDDTLTITIKNTLLKTHLRINLITLSQIHSYDLIKRNNLPSCIKYLNVFIHKIDSIDLRDLLKGFRYSINDNIITVTKY